MSSNMLPMKRVGILAGACFAIAVASATSAKAAAARGETANAKGAAGHDAEPGTDEDRPDAAEGKPAPPAYLARLGFQGGVRVAYTDGVGVVYHGVKLSDASSGALPL